jgi:hypothetical protein
MKTHSVTFSSLSVGIAALAVLGKLVVRPALALDDPSSSAAAADGTSTPSSFADSTSIESASSSNEAVASSGPDISSTSPMTTASSSFSATLPTQTPSPGLEQVHIIGTKYTDYLTDGTTITAYPGDPKIDSNLNEPNAPIPARDGLTWDHTDGTYLYDTASGDLDTGDYAVQPNGSYIENAPPFISSTSTPTETETHTVAPQSQRSDATPETDASIITLPVLSTSTSTDDSQRSSQATSKMTRAWTPLGLSRPTDRRIV